MKPKAYPMAKAPDSTALRNVTAVGITPPVWMSTMGPSSANSAKMASPSGRSARRGNSRTSARSDLVPSSGRRGRRLMPLLYAAFRPHVRREHALAQPDALRRDLDELVVVDELDRLLETQLPRRN